MPTKVDLKHYCLYTREDVLFVGLTYDGFEGKHQKVCRKTNNEQLCAFYKHLPESILDAKKHSNQCPTGIPAVILVGSRNQKYYCVTALFCDVN